MEFEKSYEALSADILCEHKSVADPGNFFHNHDGYEILLLLDGDIKYFVENEGMVMKRGHLIFINPYMYHRRELITLDRYERILINLNYYTLKRLSTEKTDLSECFHKSISSKLNVIYLDEDEINRFSDLAKTLREQLNSNDYGSDILVDSYMRELLVMMNQIAKRSNADLIIKNIMPPLVSETMAYIEEHITEELTLDTISTQLFHNGTYISRCFKKITGISLQQYIISKRIT